MKILTLNCHSLIEPDYEKKLCQFVEFVLRERPDLIALQEVNQLASAPPADPSLMDGMVSIETPIPLRADNHAARTARMLREAGASVSWAWLPVKISYDIYDEGLALLSLRGPLRDVHSIHLSRTADYMNWRTRKALAARIDGIPDRFCTTHMGWWNDEEEPFRHQWENLHAGARRDDGRVWLLGDFNAPAEVQGEGYDLIRSCGWHDAWLTARETRGEATVKGEIDGWRARPGAAADGMRIDHIWTNLPIEPRSARVIFDGISEPQVSDHFGLLLEI